jgi:WD repeat and SOF domain-containing protein 1
MGCDWSPTGEEFVSGSYDRTVRLWKRDAGKSRDVYHTKRMQRYVPPYWYTVSQLMQQRL